MGRAEETEVSHELKLQFFGLIPQIRAVSVISGKVFLRFLRSPLPPFLCVSGLVSNSGNFGNSGDFGNPAKTDGCFSYNS